MLNSLRSQAGELLLFYEPRMAHYLHTIYCTPPFASCRTSCVLTMTTHVWFQGGTNLTAHKKSCDTFNGSYSQLIGLRRTKGQGETDIHTGGTTKLIVRIHFLLHILGIFDLSLCTTEVFCPKTAFNKPMNTQ